MANSTGKALADYVLNWMKGSTFQAAPGNLYAGLFSVVPTSNTGSGTEITGSGYARQAISSASWSAISQSADTLHDQISNTATITFPAVTTPAYTVVGVGIWDALTTGNLLFYIAVTSQSVAVTNQYQIGVGALVVEV
jgi:hypothetical protein